MTSEACRMHQWRRLQRSLRLFTLMAVRAVRITMLVVWKRDPEIRYKPTCFHGCQERLAKTRKRKSSRIVRCGFHVTVQTNARHRPFASKELLPVTVQTRLV